LSGTESLDKRTYEVFATATVKFADVIERETDFVIHDWMERAQKHEDLMRIPLTFDARTGHLPQLVRDVQPDCDWMSEQRPRSPLRRVLTGTLCRKRGYTAGMLIEESRLLEVYLFTTLHKSSTQLDLIKLLPDVVTLVDELDASKTAPLFNDNLSNAGHIPESGS
jgi:hypothetical protein